MNVSDGFPMQRILFHINTHLSLYNIAFEGMYIVHILVFCMRIARVPLSHIKCIYMYTVYNSTLPFSLTVNMRFGYALVIYNIYTTCFYHSSRRLR